MIVGDLNLAAGARDVHPVIGFDGLYSDEENEEMRGLLAHYTDVWRMLHPDTTDQYTVWNERTSARAFNRVRGRGKDRGWCSVWCDTWLDVQSPGCVCWVITLVCDPGVYHGHVDRVLREVPGPDPTTLITARALCGQCRRGCG